MSGHHVIKQPQLRIRPSSASIFPDAQYRLRVPLFPHLYPDPRRLLLRLQFRDFTEKLRSFGLEGDEDDDTAWLA
jgi:hypothetical protein